MADSPTDVQLTDTQVRTLEALARPRVGGDLTAPATDQEIADELFLSVDAVHGHLRALYRKFGIEGLPPDERRARLAELANAGAPYLPDVPLATVPSPSPLAGEHEDEEKSLWPYFTFAILVLVVIGGTLSISGIFNTGSTTPPPPTAAAYKAEVTEQCKLALGDAPTTAGGDRAELAEDYLKVVTTMRTEFESLITPAIPDIALERFGNGLRNAATYTSDVAAEPPRAGSRAEAEDVAELNRAASQIRAGATGYGLGEECVALGGLVARSAQNAAAS